MKLYEKKYTSKQRSLPMKYYIPKLHISQDGKKSFCGNRLVSDKMYDVLVHEIDLRYASNICKRCEYSHKISMSPKNYWVKGRKSLRSGGQLFRLQEDGNYWIQEQWDKIKKSERIYGSHPYIEKNNKKV